MLSGTLPSNYDKEGLMSQLIQLRKQDAIAEVTLNRPEAFNAFNYEMVAQLSNQMTGLARDDRVRGIVITGKEKAFCAGGDLKWALGFSAKPGTAFHVLAAKFHQAILEIRRMGKPVVAAINGVAAGGGFSLALACDFRVMAKSAVLRQAYTSNGLSIDGGGTFTLPRLVGYARALEIAAFDEPISSDQALAWGLVTKVAEDGQVLNEAAAMLQQHECFAQHSLKQVKKTLSQLIQLEVLLSREEC